MGVDTHYSSSPNDTSVARDVPTWSYTDYILPACGWILLSNHYHNGGVDIA